MPRLIHSVPKYRQHKATGQAVVTIQGRDQYLGPWKSKASRIEYDRLVGEWIASGRPPRPSTNDLGYLTVVELLARYWRWSETYYVVSGRPSGEPARIKDAIKPLRRLYGHLSVTAFGPVALKAIRQEWIEAGLCRRHINQRIGRIKRVFKWGVAEELVSASVLHGLQAVDGLRFGHTLARETEPIKPVSHAWVDAVLPYVTPTVQAMIEVQRLTGMRGGEVCVMRAIDIDFTGEVWTYEPHTHKNRWRGHRRLIPLGPRAQAIIKPYLRPNVEAYLFSPRDSVAEANVEKRRQRKTKVQPSQADRRKHRPRKQPGDCYNSRAYYHAIRYGIARANKARRAADPNATEIPNWHPHQLRHAHATAVRRQYGLEGAQVALGHKQANIAEIYAEKNLDLAAKIAREVG